VRREAPEDVLFAANLAEVESVGIDVLQAAEAALVDEVVQRQKGRVVLQQVAHHEHAVVLRRDGDELFGIGGAQGERLFDEDVFSGLQRLAGEVGMQGSGGGDGNRFDGFVGEHLIEGARRHRVLIGELDRQIGVGVAHGGERTDLVENTDEIAAPVATADDSDGSAHDAREYHSQVVSSPSRKATRGLQPSTRSALLTSE